VIYALNISIFLFRSHENIAYGVKIIKLLIMQYCPVSYIFGELMPKHLPQRRSPLLDFDVTLPFLISETIFGSPHSKHFINTPKIAE